MQLRALFGWGIVIYAVLLLMSGGLTVYGLGGSIFFRITVLATLVITVVIATRSLRLSNERDIAPYAFGWMFCAIALDAILVIPSSGWSLFTDWNVWVGYLVLLAVPFVVTTLSRKPIL